MIFETILFEVNDRVGYLAFNRPKVRNAINMKMIDEVELVVGEIQRHGNVDVLLITGTNHSFCAGADTTDFLNMTVEENQLFLNQFEKMVKNIENLSIPVIGVINGYAFGGGAEIALACDFRIASPQASFRFPGASYGLVVSSRNLPVIVGASKAKELIFRSCVVSSEEAYRIGIVDQLIEEQELDAYAKKVAREILGNSMTAVKKVKEAINLGVGASMERRMEIENAANDYLVHQTNYRETFSSFVDQRKKRKV
ncbi:enoyl-CoA hydratase/isomerase family protein [Mesobacillus maritimus]|uniref:enoyl-CoA hydratase/isomerase family protein n=1 Tax=Mesobacillus maritimus TaxID=1643336 RepID=UPI002041A58C|nr:enoyl-CoA hydratase/isomerase family protein [Mesobacillus maritimus]MCM3668676.1 enoyl-CoA hydratase/isomerase family protein [Mesobacillus maritimus]